MSTRSQIYWKFPNGKVLTYKHSDGYPTNVIPTIVEFLNWNQGRNDQYDYLMANWFFWNKRKTEEWMAKSQNEKVERYEKTGELDYDKVPKTFDFNVDKMWLQVGYGLDFNGLLHGDIEWFYIVDFSNDITIKVYRPKYDKEYDLIHKTPEELEKNSESVYEYKVHDTFTIEGREDEIFSLVEQRVYNEGL